MSGLLKSFVNLIVEGGNDKLDRRSGSGVEWRWADQGALKLLFVRQRVSVSERLEP